VAPTVLPASFVEEVVFSSMHVLGSFVKNQLALAAWVCVWVFFLFCSIGPSVCFYFYGSVVQFKGRYNDTSSVILFA
jgi:hypothetical protein